MPPAPAPICTDGDHVPLTGAKGISLFNWALSYSAPVYQPRAMVTSELRQLLTDLPFLRDACQPELSNCTRPSGSSSFTLKRNSLRPSWLDFVVSAVTWCQ